MTDHEIRDVLLRLERLPQERWVRDGFIVLSRADVPEDDVSAVDSWVNSRRGAIFPTPSRWPKGRVVALRARAVAGREVRADPGVYELPEAELRG